MTLTANTPQIILDEGDRRNNANNPPNNNPPNNNPPNNNAPNDNPPNNNNAAQNNDAQNNDPLPQEIFLEPREEPADAVVPQNPANGHPRRRNLFNAIGLNIPPIDPNQAAPRQHGRIKLGTRQPARNRTRQLEQRREPPDYKVIFERALERATPTIKQAATMPPNSPTQGQLRLNLARAQGEMQKAAREADFPTAISALDGLRKLSEQLIASQAVVESFSGKQQRRLEDMSEALGGVRRGYFNNPVSGSGEIAASMQKAQEKAEKTTGAVKPDIFFVAYVELLKKVENLQAVRAQRDPIEHASKLREAAAMLVNQAQAYLRHYQKDLSEFDKQTEIALSSKRTCETGLIQARQLLLTAEIDELGPPNGNNPWSEEKNLKFNGLRAKFYFESGYTKAPRLKGGGQSGAYWIESTSFSPNPLPNTPQPVEDGEQKTETDAVETSPNRDMLPKPIIEPQKQQSKRFLFKPSDMADSLFGYDLDHAGLAVAKESLAFSTAKTVRELTGLDFGVPETSVAVLPGEMIEGKEPRPLIGSLQEFETSSGELRDLDELRAQVLPVEWQKVAINDIIQLNCDRHPGNFLVQPDTGPNGTPKLVPIDHGNTLPKKKDFLNHTMQIGGIFNGKVQNTTLESPGAYEKFTDEMIFAIDRIDPAAISKNMREHAKALDSVNPGLNASASLDAEALTLSERTTTFLKIAARSLSPAEIFIAINRYKELFADFERPVGSFAMQIVKEMTPLKAQLQKTFTAPLGTRRTLGNQLSNLGWKPELLVDKPDLARKLLVGCVERPRDTSLPQDPEQAVKGFDFKAVMTVRIPQIFNSFKKHLQAIEKLRELLGGLPQKVEKALAERPKILKAEPANENEAYDLLLLALGNNRLLEEEVPKAYNEYVKGLYEKVQSRLDASGNERALQFLEEFNYVLGDFNPSRCLEIYERLMEFLTPYLEK